MDLKTAIILKSTLWHTCKMYSCDEELPITFEIKPYKENEWCLEIKAAFSEERKRTVEIIEVPKDLLQFLGSTAGYAKETWLTFLTDRIDQ